MIAYVAAVCVFCTPWSLYLMYLYKSPLYPVTEVAHLYWSLNGEKFDKSANGQTISLAMTGHREKLVFKFIQPISFARLRVDPMERINGVITLHSLTAYNTIKEKVIDFAFDPDHKGWICADCISGESDSGWKIFTNGALAIASPLLPMTEAIEIDLDITAIPLTARKGFLTWLSEKNL